MPAVRQKYTFLSSLQKGLIPLLALGISTSLLPLAHGQNVAPGARNTRLPAFNQPVAESDDTRALVVNPANLAFMPGAEFRWSAAYLDDRAPVNAQGHAFALGFHLPYIPIATGFRFDAVNPPSALESIFSRASNYQWFTWGLALAPSQTSALGLTFQHAYSSSALFNGASSWSLGFSQRPSDYIGFGFAAHDLNAPASDFGLVLNRSYDFGVVLRPDGSRTFDLGLESKFIDDASQFVGDAKGTWVPRATLGFDLPSLGRLEGELSVANPSEANQRAWQAGASLVMQVNSPNASSELAAGTIFGETLGKSARNQAQNNIHTELATRLWRESAGVPEKAYALRLRLEKSGDARSQVALLRGLWYLAEKEPSVKAVVLEVRTAPGESLAHVQELRDAIYYLRQHGKKVLCHLEDATGMALYLCAAADRILINPAGGLRFAGMRAQYMYYKGLLDKLGIKADFVRIGDHKSAPEALMRAEAMPTAKADHIDLLQQFELEFSRGIAYDRKLDLAKLRESFKTGPFIAPEAKAAGLVDGFAHDDQLEEEVQKLTGQHLPLLNDQRVARAPTRFGNQRGIAMIYVDGDMVDGRSSTIPFLGMNLVGSYTIADAIKQARENPKIAAVLLRIETGGGSAMGADVIWRELEITSKIKPVVVSMGGAAASGGYYIAAPAQRIFANPLSITGSIGIFYGKADIVGLMEKLGLTVETYKTAPRADAESMYRPFSPTERVELEHKVGQFYDMFLSRVAAGRKLEKSAVDKVGQGRVWTGAQARTRGLVDELGGLRQALRYTQALVHVDEEAPILELPVVETSIIGEILGIPGIHAGSPPILPEAVLRVARALTPFMVFEADKPLARTEIVSILP